MAVCAPVPAARAATTGRRRQHVLQCRARVRAVAGVERLRSRTRSPKRHKWQSTRLTRSLSSIRDHRLVPRVRLVVQVRAVLVRASDFEELFAYTSNVDIGNRNINPFVEKLCHML